MSDDPAPDRVTWWPLAATCLGTFLLLAYTTIVTVALPRIGADLGAGFSTLQWIVDVYTLALAGLLLGTGALGDRWGRRRLYVGGVALFTVATVLCGIAPGSGTLVAARAVQGIGGAVMFGCLLPLIASSYRGAARGRAFAIWGVVAGASAGLGNIAGGLITDALSWRWLFLLAVPICLLTLFLSARVLPEEPGHRRPVDVAGLLLFTVAAAGVTFGVIRGGETGWSAPTTVGAFVVAAAAAVAFGMVENRVAAPVLPPQLFARPAFGALLLAAGAYYLAAFGALPVMSLWLEDTAGLTPSGTALLITVQQAGFVLTSGLLGGRLHRARPRWTVGGGTLLVGVGNLAFFGLHDGSTPAALVAGLALTGIGAGMVSPVLPAVAMAAAPDEQSGVASAAANTARQLGLALGVAGLGTVYGHFLGPAGGASAGLNAVVLVAAAIALVAGVVAVRMLTAASPAELAHAT